MSKAISLSEFQRDVDMVVALCNVTTWPKEAVDSLRAYIAQEELHLSRENDNQKKSSFIRETFFNL